MDREIETVHTRNRPVERVSVCLNSIGIYQREQINVLAIQNSYQHIATQCNVLGSICHSSNKSVSYVSDVGNT